MLYSEVVLATPSLGLTSVAYLWDRLDLSHKNPVNSIEKL
jgi:hypothetical protein